MTREAARRPDPRRSRSARRVREHARAAARPVTLADAHRRAPGLGLGRAPARRRHDALARRGRAPRELPTGRLLPGAQQLELLRRLNAGRPPRRRRWSSGVLGRQRARPRPARPRAGRRRRRVAASGPPPVDPADLPDGELVRVAAGVLAEDVVAAGVPPAPRGRRAAALAARATACVGDPELADPLRAAAGRPRPAARRPRPARRSSLGTDRRPDAGRRLDRAAPSTTGAPALARLAAAAAAPPRPAPGPRRPARRRPRPGRGRVGRDRVHVVLDPGARARGWSAYAAPLPCPAPLPARGAATWPAGSAPCSACSCRPTRATALLPTPAAAAARPAGAPARPLVVPPEAPRLGRDAPPSGCARACGALATLCTATWTPCSRGGRTRRRPGAGPTPRR